MLVYFIIFLLAGSSIFPIINSKSMKKTDIETEETNNICDLLIISPSCFKWFLNPLVNHKEKYGVKTTLVSLDYIYEKIYYGNTKQEKIKLFIKDAYDNSGIKYVLLVGGKISQSERWYLPPSYVDTGNNWDRQILSDLYYADIYDSEGNFSSWDSDGDNKYSEWFSGGQPEDRYIDLHPDVAIGRLPCRNIIEVIIMVRKIINYEKTTYDQPWFNKIIAIAGDTYPEYINPNWTGYEGEYYADMIIENLTGFEPIRLYTSLGTYTKWEDLIDPVSQGCGFLYFGGHGSAMTWSTHFPNDKNRTSSFKVYKMTHLKNRGKLPICVVGGCHNAQYDVSIFKYFNETTRWRGEGVFECWAWVMTRKIGGGSIATIGESALGYTKEDKDSFDGGKDICEVEFFTQIGQNNVEILGEAWQKAVSYYIDRYPIDWEGEVPQDSWVDLQIIQTWTLIGDPSLKIGGYPQAIN